MLTKRIFPLLLSALLLTSTVLAADASVPAAAQSSPVPAVSVEEDSWKTILVNPQTLLPKDFSVELVTLKNGLQVDQRIYDDLDAMLTACREAGLHPLVCSAYRSEDTQTRLHLNKIARLRAAGYGWEAAQKEAARWVAVPGTSEHQTGLALDIVAASYPYLNHWQANTAEQQWLMEHCWEYGFILRYPAEKCDLTGIGYEPWHYRYVGRELSAELRESGLCLEEYLTQPEIPPAAEAPSPESAAAPTPDAASPAPAEETELPAEAVPKAPAPGRDRRNGCPARNETCPRTAGACPNACPLQEKA